MSGRAALVCLLLIAGCAAKGGHDEDQTSSSTFAIQSVPGDVRCVDVTIVGATRTVEKKYDVVPGQSSVYHTGGLPIGGALVSANAYNTTCTFAPGTPTWIADTQNVNLSNDFESTIFLTLHPNGQAAVSANFQEDSYTVSTYLGKAGTAGTTDGTGTGALLQSPWGLAVSGNHLYVQSWPGITRDVNLGTAATTTLATEGAASNSVVLGNALYITDWWDHCIDKLDLTTKTWSVLAGSGDRNLWGYADAVGTAARFTEPTGITTDGVSLFVADGTNTVRMINPATAEVTTVAGHAWSPGAADGPLTDALFNRPEAITFWLGKLYLADMNNHDIRTIDFSTGTVTRLAGNPSTGAGFLDGIGGGALFGTTQGIIADGRGNLFVTDSQYHAVRKIVIATGATLTVAGARGAGATDGPSSTATFNAPLGIAIDGSGNLYVSEFNNHTVRKLTRQ
jgi:hypothetical protein